MAMPKVLKNFHLYIDGIGYAGIADEVTLATLTVITEDHRAGGMDSAVKIDLGLETPEISFKLSEHSAAVYKQFGLRNQNAVKITFRGALVDDTTTTPYIITAQGMYTEINPGTVATGGKNPMEATLSCRYYKVEIAGETVIEIDVDNLKRVIGGVDQLELMRTILNG